MAGKEPLAPANAVLIGIAALTGMAALANAICALATDAVWVISARGFSINRVEHAGDPFSFWVILLSTPALAAYFIWDIWRRPRAR